MKAMEWFSLIVFLIIYICCKKHVKFECNLTFCIDRYALLCDGINAFLIAPFPTNKIKQGKV